jgi:hypothetical protein
MSSCSTSSTTINAEGEFQAAARLSDAADVISRNPVTIQLRNLQTLIEVSSNQSSTIVFPLPMDVLAPLISASQNGRRDAAQSLPSLPAATPPPQFDEALAAARVALEQAKTENPAPRVLAEAPPASATAEPTGELTAESVSQ